MSDPRCCPICKGPSGVADTRPAGVWGAKRRRFCKPDDPTAKPCPVRWTTYERRGRVDYLDLDEEKTQPVLHHPGKLNPTP